MFYTDKATQRMYRQLRQEGNSTEAAVHTIQLLTDKTPSTSKAFGKNAGAIWMDPFDKPVGGFDDGRGNKHPFPFHHNPRGNRKY